MRFPDPIEFARFRPWWNIWFHPRYTIQKIIDVEPWYQIYLLIPLYGLALGFRDWLDAVAINSGTFRENAFLAVGNSLLLNTTAIFASCLVLQWITGLREDRVTYAHLVAANYWGAVPSIGFLVLFLVRSGGAALASTFLPSASAVVAAMDRLQSTAWYLLRIWSLVLTVGALSQVMKCSVVEAIGRQIVTALVLAIPTLALYRLFSNIGDGYASIAGSVAVLLFSALVLFAMYRASRAKSTDKTETTVKVEPQAVEEAPPTEKLEEPVTRWRPIAVNFIIALLLNALVIFVADWLAYGGGLARYYTPMCLPASVVMLAFCAYQGKQYAKDRGISPWIGATIGVWIGAIISIAFSLYGLLGIGPGR